MKSIKSQRFRKCLEKLSDDVRRQAREAYRLFRQNESHPGLAFKKVHPKEPVYSVRIGLNHRAVGVKQGDSIVWYWIGTHDEYDTILASWK